MNASRALGISLLALVVVSCSQHPEQSLIAQFFAASRLRDLTAVSKVSDVVFEPASDGIVTGFEITEVDGPPSSKAVAIAAPVKLMDGRTVWKRFVITIEAGRVTKITEQPASPSIPPP